MPLAQAGTLRIVSSLPSKGIFARETAQTRRAIDAAIQTYAARTGTKLEHVPLEGGSDETGEWTAVIEERNARAAAGDPSVIAYVGPHNSGAAAVALPITSRAGLLESSPSATWPGLTLAGWDAGEPGKYYQANTRNFVRLPAADSYQAWAAADWIAADGAGPVLALHDGSSYGEGMAKTFASRPESGSPRIASVDTSGETVQLPSLQGYRAVFFAPSSVQSAVRVARSLHGTGIQVYATDVALDPQFLELAGDTAANWHIVSNGATSPADRLAALFPDVPAEITNSRPALSAYAITRLVVEAVERGATDRAGVLSQVYARTLPDGSRLFDEAGDVTTWKMVGYRASGGVFEKVREFSR